MTQQFLYNLYCYLIVGFIGNTFIGWELGKKGWIQLGLEGPRNKRVAFAIYCFVGMVVWGAVSRLENPLNSWTSLWAPAWGIAVFGISRMLKPRSLRLYERAKFLHERTYTGDWHQLRTDTEIAALRQNQWLRKAEHLYLEALTMQEQLSQRTAIDADDIRHRLNVAVTYCQLALLYRQWQYLEKACKAAEKAVEITEDLINAGNEKYKKMTQFTNTPNRLKNQGQKQSVVASGRS